MLKKIKQFIENEKGKDILTLAVVVLVGLGSFGLGRLSKLTEHNPIYINYKEQPANTLKATESLSDPEPTTPAKSLTPKEFVKENPTLNTGSEAISSGGAFFASRIGKKYYSLGCSAGKTIKKENRIYFQTETEAINAGFEKSASCK